MLSRRNVGRIVTITSRVKDLSREEKVSKPTGCIMIGKVCVTQYTTSVEFVKECSLEVTGMAFLEGNCVTSRKARLDIPRAWDKYLSIRLCRSRDTTWVTIPSSERYVVQSLTIRTSRQSRTIQVKPGVQPFPLVLTKGTPVAVEAIYDVLNDGKPAKTANFKTIRL